MNSSDKNPAQETYDRLQRKTALPLVLVVAVVALAVKGASIWMLPIVFGIGLVYAFVVFGGGRLVAAGIERFRGRRRGS
jgi:hypothetical protein